MTSPIKTGDLCEVIGGMKGSQSPNLGLIVRVLAFRGEHSLYGRIWRCEAAYAELGQAGVDVPPGTADFAQYWLKKIEPPPITDTTQTNVSKEITA